MEHHHLRCPNCGRETTENEAFCYFCEIDIHELASKHKKDPQKKQKNKFLDWFKPKKR